MLRWNGKGIIYGIPARDLTEQETKEYGGAAYLLSTGVYMREEKELTPKNSNKLLQPNSEDKEK